MKVRIQVIVESDHGATQCVEDVAEFERGALQPDALGLTLAEAKALLQGVQRTIVAEQTTCGSRKPVATVNRQVGACVITRLDAHSDDATH